MSFSSGDTVVIDTTSEKEGEIAAFHVYGENYEERYFPMSSYDEIVEKIKQTKHSTVCLETGDSLREILAIEYLKRVNVKRKAAGKNPKTAVYPVTEWKAVYDIARELFRTVGGEKTFIITEGTKDKYAYDKERQESVNTGKQAPDGLKILPTIADIVLNIKIEKNKRKVVVVKNRFVNRVGDDWIEEAEDVVDLINKMVEKGSIKREWVVM